MRAGRDGQSQVLTAVLIGAILVAGITSAYLWGLPILQKNRDVSSARQTLGDMKTVSSGIADVAQSGGSRSIPINVGSGTLLIDENEDTITFRALNEGAYVSTDQWVPMNEDDLQGVNEDGTVNRTEYGVRGPDRPGLLVGHAEAAGNQFLTEYRIVFRNLYDPSSGQTYRIDLIRDGNLQASNGQYSIEVSKGEERIDASNGVNNGPLRRIRVLIRVS